MIKYDYSGELLQSHPSLDKLFVLCSNGSSNESSEEDDE